MFCTLVAARLLAAATPTVSQHRDPACSGGPEPETSAQSFRTEGICGSCSARHRCAGKYPGSVLERVILGLAPTPCCVGGRKSACTGCRPPQHPQPACSALVVIFHDQYGAVADQGLGRMEEATNLCLCIPRSSPVSPARRGQHLTDRPPECPSGDTGDRSAELIQVSRCGVATAHTNYPLHLNASLN